MQTLERLFTQWSDAIWGPPMIILLLGTHLFLTFRLRFIQKYIGKAIKISFSRAHEGEGDVSQFGAMTGLVLVNSGEWMNGAHGAALTKAAFADIPVFGPMLLTFGLLTFVFSTLLGWSYYGEKASEYLFGTRAVRSYRYIWVLCVMLGSVVPIRMVWSFADITNAAMAIPNLVSLLALSGVIVAETRKYLWDGDIDGPTG